MGLDPDSLGVPALGSAANHLILLGPTVSLGVSQLSLPIEDVQKARRRVTKPRFSATNSEHGLGRTTHVWLWLLKICQFCDSDHIQAGGSLASPSLLMGRSNVGLRR
jgi:hypothetical protein